jgi:hypothetical protein
MYLASQSNTQVYSPLGSYVVEQHDKSDEGARRRPSHFEPLELPRRKATDVLSNEQAAVALSLQSYFPIHAVGPTPTRLQILLNMLLHRTDPR